MRGRAGDFVDAGGRGADATCAGEDGDIFGRRGDVRTGENGTRDPFVAPSALGRTTTSADRGRRDLCGRSGGRPQGGGRRRMQNDW